jgi:hypothetical protein
MNIESDELEMESETEQEDTKKFIIYSYKEIKHL